MADEVQNHVATVDPDTEGEAAFFAAMNAMSDVTATQHTIEKIVGGQGTEDGGKIEQESRGNGVNGSNGATSLLNKPSAADDPITVHAVASGVNGSSDPIPEIVSGVTSVSARPSVAVPVAATAADGESFPSKPSTPVQGAPTPASVQAALKTTPSSRPSVGNNAGKRKRLPQDVVGQLEDRIAEDPRGDIDAWLMLIEEHRRKGKYDSARQVYERFFVLFPTAAQQWVNYIKMELDNNELPRVEQIFARCLLQVPNVELWSMYLDYIRRRNNLSNDPAGKARGIVSQAYEFVLNNIGCDKEAGRIWNDHIHFVKSAPGHVGGQGWMDQQKMDNLRRVYQKAVTQPVVGVEPMWREYDAFEKGLNKETARRFLQEKSPAFMTARGCLIELNNITRGLRRETLPRLPPQPGFDGDEDWAEQVSLWKKWINWEKEDPLVLANEDIGALRGRVIYTYKQALMALRFWPEMWYDAVEYCFSNDMADQGMDFLKQGLSANPESCLLTFRYAERLEATIPADDGEEGQIQKGKAVRKPYDDLLNALYTHITKVQTKEKEELARLEEVASDGSKSPQNGNYEDDDEDPDAVAAKIDKQHRMQMIKDSSKAQIMAMSKIISATWINLMRAMRRIQGHGRVNEPLGGSRQIFADARKRGKITSDVYVASALIEYHCYRDPAALKIFERGMKLFPEDEDFAIAYLRHLININDITNARAVFETFVGKVTPEKAYRVFRMFHEYESHYGELGQVYKLEQRMSELYPADPALGRFSTRYAYNAIDPCSTVPVVSPARQYAPKRADQQQYSLPAASENQTQLPIAPTNVGHPAPPPSPPRVSSPKRPATDDEDMPSRARKMARPDSPLKGAAGRRLNQIKQSRREQAQQQQQGQGWENRGPANNDRRDGGGRNDNHAGGSLPDMVMYLLRILPGADKYRAVRFKPEEMVRLLASVNLPNASQVMAQGGLGGQYNR